MGSRGALPAAEESGVELIDRGVLPSAQTMTLDKVFWSHLCNQVAPSSWVLGALLVGIGLDFRSGLIALVVGNLVAGFVVGACATIGPATGLTQIEISRYSFGRIGTRMPAFLNWICSVGWDAVNNVPSVLALAALVALFGLRLPFWLGLAVLAALQMTASIRGHHLVQLVTKYGGYALTLVFAITEIVAIARGGSLPAAHAPVTPALVLVGVAMIAGSGFGFAPFTSDYTRYLPPATNRWSVFATVVVATAGGAFALEACGFIIASRLVDLSPAGIITTISGLMGPLAPIALIAIALSAIVINAMNDNTAAYSLISAGVRVRRYLAAVITALCGYALAVAGEGSFAMLFSQFVVLLGYWIAPWTGIVIADRYVVGPRALPPRRWESGAVIWAIVTPVTLVLFSSSTIYTGPIARALGGSDIGFVAGFFGAAGLYVLAERSRRRHPDREAVPGADVAAA
jgi:NCS1 family nucleobase:cation symporter-1